jgi:1-deoxy-D-xylulose-5-phosphate synthase
MKDPSEIAHFDMRFVKPLDTALLHQIFKSHTTIFTVEDGIIKGGFGTAVLEFASENEYYNKVRVLGIPDNFITHGSISELQNKIGLDPNSLAVLFSKA